MNLDSILARIASSRVPVEPQPEPNLCPICRGAGVLRGEGFLPTYTACGCQIAKEWEEKQDRRRAISGLYPRMTFATWESASKGLEIVWQTAQKFARSPEGWIAFSGPYGCGKTHLACAIGHVALEADTDVLFRVVPDLLASFRAAFSPSSTVNYDEQFEMVRQTDLLILDDFGAQQTTPWATEALFRIVDYRSARELPTVITTNLTLATMDARLASRLGNANLTQFISISGPDKRMGGAQ